MAEKQTNKRLSGLDANQVLQSAYQNTGQLTTGGFATAEAGNRIERQLSSSTVETYYYLDKAANFTGTLTSGSAIVTGLPETHNITVGMQVRGVGLANFTTTVLSIDSSSQITLNSNASISGAQSLTFYDLLCKLVVTYETSALENIVSAERVE